MQLYRATTGGISRSGGYRISLLAKRYLGRYGQWLHGIQYDVLNVCAFTAAP